MDTLTVKINSITADLVNANCTPFIELKKQLKSKFWTITLLNDKARIETIGTKTVKIPAKALNDAETLCAWLLERAEKFFRDAKAACKY